LGEDLLVRPEDTDARFKDLYERYYQRIVSYIVNNYRIPRDKARELAQDAFLRVYQSMDRYRGEAEWAFLKITASRVTLNEHRRRDTQGRKGLEVAIEEHSQLPSPEASPEEDFVNREKAERRKRWLHDAIETLPDTQRECLLLFLNGLKYDEIQKALKISLDAVKTRLHKARKRLEAQRVEELEGIDWPALPGEDDHDQEE
jgi:RNA polymerase sigma-70 factor (ECF subfamily)